MDNNDARELYEDLKNGTQCGWRDTIFFKGAYDHICLLERIYNEKKRSKITFLEIEEVHIFKIRINSSTASFILIIKHIDKIYYN